jgi:hypothetical protein
MLLVTAVAAWATRAQGQNIQTSLQTPFSKDVWDAAAEKAKWTKRIGDVGPKQAYADFVSAYEEDSAAPFAHIAIHLLSDLLYDAENLDAISYCDTSFGYGCYHQYFRRAITEYSTNIIAKMGELCHEMLGEDSGTCMHGIGHGLMEQFGLKKIDQAFAVCSLLSGFPGAINNCRTGIFMEYLVPIYFTEAGAERISPDFDASKPYAPCQTAAITDEYKLFCYKVLPAWWNRSAHLQLPAYTDLCLAAPTPYKKTCLIGVGQEIFNTHEFDIEASKQACQSMPDARAVAWCVAGVESMPGGRRVSN